MKARVRAISNIPNIPERVLTYAVEESIQPRLSAALEKLRIEEYRVSPEETELPVGRLAGLPGYEEKRPFQPAGKGKTAAPARGFLCMCGLSDKRMDELLDLLRREEIFIPIRAKLTETNKDWSFAAWMEELSREHEAVVRQLKNRQAGPENSGDRKPRNGA